MQVKKELFLDTNAHHSINSKALQAIVNFNSIPASNGHPSSPNYPGREAAKILEQSRAKIAKAISAKPSQIIFTSTCTEACSWAVNLLKSRNLPIFTSPIEHPAVSRSLDNFDHQELKINKNGVVLEQDIDLAQSICMLVQNEIGIIQPLNNIKSSFLFSDMSQALGKIPIDISNVDIAVFAGHKIGAIGGGFIYLKSIDEYKAFDFGSRYFMDRAGTPNLYEVISMATALEDAMETLPQRTLSMTQFQSTLESGLESLGFEVIAKEEKRAPSTTFVKCPKDGQGIQLLFQLGEQQIYVGLGSACGNIMSNGSPLMQRLSRPSNGQDYLRISQTGNYDGNDAEYFLKQLKFLL